MATQNIGLSAQVTTTSFTQTITSSYISNGTPLSYTQPTSGVMLTNVGGANAQYRIDSGAWVVLDKNEGNYIPVDLSVNMVSVKLINDGATSTTLEYLVESMPTAYVGPTGETFPVANPPVTITGYRYSGSVATAVPGTGYTFTAGQWYRNGVAIGGQTAMTYTRTNTDIGTALTFIPTGIAFTASGGTTLVTPIVMIPATPLIATPTTIGAPTTFSSTDTVTSQQWTLDAVDVVGATGATYTQAIADSSLALRVRATSGAGTATSLPAIAGVRNMRLANTVIARSILSSNDGLFLFSGDSYIAGFGAAGQAYAETNLKASSVSSRWATALAAAGFSTSNTSYMGSGRFSNNTPAIFMDMDPRWNVGANMSILDQSVYPTFGGSLVGPSTNVAHAAQVMTFTPGGTFDTVDMYCARSQTAGNMEVSVDGGVTPIQTVVFAQGAAGYGDVVKVTVTVPAGSTAVTFKYVQGSPTGTPFLAGVETRTAASPKIRFVNGARSGTTVQANAAAPTTVANAGAYVPRAVMQKIATGITKGVLVLNGWYNDRGTRSVAQINADYNTLCVEAKARGWEIWYVGYGQLSESAITKAAFDSFEVPIVNNLVTVHDAVIFQNNKVFTDFLINNPQGYYYDDIHLGPTGHQKWAESMTAICKVLASGQLPA